MTSQNTVVELKSIAKSLGLKGYSNLRKNELIDMINSKKSLSPQKILSPKNITSPKISKEPQIKPPKLPEFSPYHFKKIEVQKNAKSPKMSPLKISSPKVQSSKVQSPKIQSQKIKSPKVQSPKVQSPKSPKILPTQMILPPTKINGPPIPIRPETPQFAISLEFHTHTASVDKKYLVPPVILNLYFDSNGKYIQDNHIDYFQSHAIFHLIKRASGRLALNTTNELLKDNKTELVSISIEIPDFKDNLEPIETLYLQEIRQYTSQQQIKNTLKKGLNKIIAPIRGLITGKLDTSKDSFQRILADKYPSIDDKDLYDSIYYGTNKDFVEVTVPFHLVIHNLAFPISIQSGEIYTLLVSGLFLRVHIQGKHGEIIHGDTSSLKIEDVKLLNSKENAEEIKILLKECKFENDCIFFEPEL